MPLLHCLLANIDTRSLLFMRSFIADGNFKAVHLKQKDDASDVWLTSGEGFMTNEARYQIHLQKAQETKSVSGLVSPASLGCPDFFFPVRNPPATAIELS